MYNRNMKNKLPRKYRIISKVCRSDAPENIVSLRYVGMHNRFADDSRRVRRSDAPEKLAFSRYVDRYNDDAGMGKMAETLVLSGFAGGGGLYQSPVRLSTLSTVIKSTQIACPSLAGWTKSTFIPGNPLKADDHLYIIQQKNDTS